MAFKTSQNKPTRGIPLTDEEKERGAAMRRSAKPWFGGTRYITMPKNSSGTKHSGTARRTYRSDWGPGSTTRQKK